MKGLVQRNMGLDCDYMIMGDSNEESTSEVAKNAWYAHAINVQEMTSDMRNRIKENNIDTADITFA